MKYYELTYLISPELPEEEAKSFQEKIASFAQEEGAILDEKSNPIRKKLAYPIKRQLQAYLVFLTFQMAPEKTTSLKSKLEEESQILRYLLINKIKREKAAFRPRRRIEFTPEALPAKTPEEKKVELKEIDEKLEEILEEK